MNRRLDRLAGLAGVAPAAALESVRLEQWNRAARAAGARFRRAEWYKRNAARLKLQRST